MKGIAHFVEEGLVSGIMKCLFIKQHLTFEELRNGYLNTLPGSNSSRNFNNKAYDGDIEGIEFEKIVNCFALVNFKNFKFYRFVGDTSNIIHQVSLENIIEINYSCVDLAIR